MSVITRRPKPAPLPLTGGSSALGDHVFWGACRTAAFSVILLAIVLFIYIVMEAWPAIERLGLQFLISTDWDPRSQNLGALPFIYGTLWTSGMAMLCAVPLGVATAAFLAEIAPPTVRRVGSFMIELLAAIPSVVYGFWAIKFLAPLTRSMFLALGAPGNVQGDSLFTAGLVLAVMILPYVTAISFDVCRAVPGSQREGSLALGATRWQTIWNVILPYARPGIFGGCFLALGRALGETMAVIMVVGNVPRVALEPYSPGATIASQIALGLNELGGIERAALVELGAILLLVTIVVNCLARLLIWRVASPRPTTLFLEKLSGLFWGKAVPGCVMLVLSFLIVRVCITALNFDAGKTGTAALVVLLTLVLAALAWLYRRTLGKSHRGAVGIDRLMTGVLGLCLVVTCGPLFLILGFIAVNGLGALDSSFFIHRPGDDPPGLAHAIFGTTVLVAMATIFAVPIGLLAAIFLAENPRSSLTKSVRFVGELLGGVPSVVIGIFVYALMVAPGEGRSFASFLEACTFGLVKTGFTAWAGAFALGIMMVPIVMRGSEEALKLVPQSLRQASYALGAASWQTVLRVTVPAALPAVITGVCLAIARIAGETAPLLLTVNQTSFWPKELNQPFPYLTYYIYHYANSTDDTEKRLAWAAAFVLLTVVMVVNIGIRFLTGKRVVLASRAD
jgi:phosphate transport system permease protein